LPKSCIGAENADYFFVSASLMKYFFAENASGKNIAISLELLSGLIKSIIVKNAKVLKLKRN
jgi:hypothetical protein